MRHEEALAVAVRAVDEWRTWHRDRSSRFPRECVDKFGQSRLLGLMVGGSAGGADRGMREAVQAVERIAEVCASTATILQSHYAATAVLDPCGPHTVCQEIATGKPFATLVLAKSGGAAVAVAELAPEVCPDSAAQEGAETRRRVRDAWAACALSLAPHAGLEHIVHGVWSAASQQAVAPQLVAAGNSAT